MMNDESLSTHDLRRRTKLSALGVLRFHQTLPKLSEAQISGKQMLRSGTSVGAHYREATRARSDAEFISKLEVGLQELEETQYWLELLSESGLAPKKNREYSAFIPKPKNSFASS